MRPVTLTVGLSGKRWHFPLLLTFADGSASAGLRQAVALTHRAAETHVHEALSGGRQRRST